MIRRFREIAASIQEDFADDLRALGPQEEEEIETEEDPGLDLLVKNAIRSNWLEHDPKQVWQQLSERVRGPFGSMAVEEPAMRGQSMPFTVDSTAHNNDRPEKMRHSFFRLSDSVFPQR
jgi:hypothetical protein